MTEKLYRMVNTNLVDDDGLVYYLIKKDEDDVCQVFGKHTAKAIVDELNNLHEENKQLKSTIKEVTELLVKEVDLFSEKATEHDINAYLELKELDNKDAFYMATATKEAIKMLKGLIMND